jgi:hypothetical protein
MPAAAAAGAGQATPGGGGAAGGNPFQLATNLYCEKNNAGNVTAANGTITTSQAGFGGQINAGQYLRGIRLVVRANASASVTTQNAATNDWPWNVLTQIDLVNVDGSEILYVMGGYAHYLAQKYGRPWLGDPGQLTDAVNSTTAVPQFTLFLQPEIRWTAGVLANTDTRSQYRFDYTLDTIANITGANGSSYNTGSQAPIVTVQPYVDAWAQPDAEDLQGVPNQPVPPGLNIQYKRRHQIFTMNANASDNIFQSALTGNAIRNQIIVTRNGGSVRSEGLTDPIQWSLDNRSLGKISVNNMGAGAGTAATAGQVNGDMLQVWMQEQYGEYFPARITGSTVNTVQYARETGVYVFPRFLKPGSLYGQGWLYTSNSSKEIFESTSGVATSATAELITDEVYPVGPVDPQLTDI